VAKKSPGKVGVAGRKWAWRRLGGTPAVGSGPAGAADAGTTEAGDEVATEPTPPAGEARPLQVAVVRAGVIVHRPPIAAIRARHAAALEEWPDGATLKVRFRE
jgi:hypothetical protein